jgi:hypothetical protein
VVHLESQIDDAPAASVARDPQVGDLEGGLGARNGGTLGGQGGHGPSHHGLDQLCVVRRRRVGPLRRRSCLPAALTPDRRWLGPRAACVIITTDSPWARRSLTQEKRPSTSWGASTLVSSSRMRTLAPATSTLATSTCWRWAIGKVRTLALGDHHRLRHVFTERGRHLVEIARHECGDDLQVLGEERRVVGDAVDDRGAGLVPPLEVAVDQPLAVKPEDLCTWRWQGRGASLPPCIDAVTSARAVPCSLLSRPIRVRARRNQ